MHNGSQRNRRSKRNGRVGEANFLKVWNFVDVDEDGISTKKTCKSGKEEMQNVKKKKKSFF